MFYFFWFIVWYINIAPLILLIIYPFYKIDILLWGKYLLNELQIKQVFIKESEYVQKGFILANHRCYFDFFFDTFISHGAIVGRRFAFLITLFGSTLLNLHFGIITFYRGKDSRKTVFNKMLKHNLVLFFPEGTRLRHNVIESIDHVKQLLRYGLLKEIYYHQLLPVQIQMSSNKELVIDERKFKINKNVIVKTHLSKPIYPADYKTEQEFYDAIANQWYNSWIITHSTL